jgi:hypothetical protein
MKNVLLLGGPASGQMVQVHGTMDSVHVGAMRNADAPAEPWDTADRTFYHVVPLCSHGVVHWFGVMDKAQCPLAELVQGYNSDVANQLQELRRTLAVLEAARPHWAKGYTSDGVAAQCLQAALSTLWGLLGVSNQTQAVQAVKNLMRGYAPGYAKTEPMENRVYSKVCNDED